MSKPTKFGCRNCGQPYEVYPPDATHTNPLPEPCKEGDSVEMGYECENCNFRNILHWDKQHFYMATG